MYYVVNINDGHQLQDRFRDFDRDKQFTDEGFDMIYDDLEAIGYEKVDVVEICGMYSEAEALDYIDEIAEASEVYDWLLGEGLDGAELIEAVGGSDCSMTDLLGFVEKEGFLKELLEYYVDGADNVIGVTSYDTVLVRE